MSTRPARLPTRFENLLSYPPSQPIRNVTRHVPLPTAVKRERDPTPHPLANFNVTDDPEDCLRRYHAVQLAVRKLADPGQRARAWLTSAEAALMDFVSDQAAVCTVYGDCETTDLIRHGTAIGDMTISVATLLFVEDGGSTMLLSFWGDASLGRGAPLRFFRHALDHAERLVFYNAAFDLTLAAGGDELTVQRWWERTFDPYKLLRDAFGNSVRLKLDVLLRDNGLAPKTATGVEAVRFYADGRYDDLEQYNQADVLALRQLVELPRIRLSNGQITSIGTLGASVLNPLASSRYPSGDARALAQGSPEWLRARKGLLTASNAGAALGVAGAFRSRAQVAATLHAQLNGLQEPDDVETDDGHKAAMARGQLLEPVARQAYERLRGVRVEQSGLHLHPRHPQMLAASPDGIVLRPNGDLSDLLVEVKVPRLGSTGAGLTDAYLCQLQLTMACTGTRRVDFVVLRELPSGRELAITRVERDDAMLVALERQLVAFYEETKEDNEPYPLDSADVAELRMAMRATREESVGKERVALVL